MSNPTLIEKIYKKFVSGDPITDFELEHILGLVADAEIISRDVGAGAACAEYFSRLKRSLKTCQRARETK